MAISRSQLVKELEPGLNALFGLEYNRYENQHAEIFPAEASDRAFEEEVMLSGFGSALRTICMTDLQLDILEHLQDLCLTQNKSKRLLF
jgi:hypothetical protein